MKNKPKQKAKRKVCPPPALAVQQSAPAITPLFYPGGDKFNVATTSNADCYTFYIKSPDFELSPDTKQYELNVNLPEYTKKDLYISANGYYLEIAARNQKREYLQAVALPQYIHKDKISAKFENGNLKVTIPVKKYLEPYKKIKIN